MNSKGIRAHLAGCELHLPILLVLREDPRVQHRRVGGLGAVLPAEHPERQLRVVHHRGHDEPGFAESPPVRPGSLDVRVPAQRAAGSLRRGERGIGGEGEVEVQGGAKAFVGVLFVPGRAGGHWRAKV